VSFALWLTGLSGSGKSAIARELLAQLHERGVDAAVLESDVLRTQLTPFPRYDEADRDFFYAALAEMARVLSGTRPVIVDATANLRRYRDAARARIERFAEVCRQRDPKGLYRKARGMPGVGAPYEPPLSPELTLHGDRGTPAQGAAEIVAFLAGRGWTSA
jgi:adenylylsulfate kinase-like enzyme